MTSFKQIEANRRNARRSTGPVTEDGKLQSRRNAVRHGLTAETVIGALEDADDYQAFEAAVIADYDAQSAVERELVLRLASLLWRIRRATTMETGLFEIQAKHVLEYRRIPVRSGLIRRFFPSPNSTEGARVNSEHLRGRLSGPNADHGSADLAQCFLRLAQLADLPARPPQPLRSHALAPSRPDHLCLEALHRRKPWETGRRFRPAREPSITDIDEND